jgi:hypothetical protein
MTEPERPVVVTVRSTGFLTADEQSAVIEPCIVAH